MEEKIKKPKKSKKSDTPYSANIVFEHSFETRPMNILKSAIVENEEGKWYMDFRLFFENREGAMMPTRKGFRISVEFINELEESVQKIKEYLDSSTSIDD